MSSSRRRFALRR